MQTTTVKPKKVKEAPIGDVIEARIVREVDKRVAKQTERLKKEVTHYQGKFQAVRHENNILREKLYHKEKSLEKRVDTFFEKTLPEVIPEVKAEVEVVKPPVDTLTPPLNKQVSFNQDTRYNQFAEMMVL